MAGGNNTSPNIDFKLTTFVCRPFFAPRGALGERETDDLEQQAAMSTIANVGSEYRDQPRNHTDTRPTAFLDGLRGVAAFIVYTFHHISWVYSSDDAILHGFGYHGERYLSTFPFVRIFFTGGSAAVAIFFVLSGYVLSRSSFNLLLNGQNRKLHRNLWFATIRRPLRLFIPPTAVSLTFALILHLPLGLAPCLDWPESQQTTLAELRKWLFELVWALNPFKKHGIFEPWFPYDPPVWTMPVEFENSMFVFALLAISTTVKHRYLSSLYILLGLCLLFLYQWSMACFIAGMVLALNDAKLPDSALDVSRLPRLVKSAVYHISFILGWYLLCETAGHQDPERSFNTTGWYWLTKLVPSSYYHNDYWRFWQSNGAALLVFGVLRLHYVQLILTKRPLRYLGRISFSLYLTHIPFLWVVGDRVYRFSGAIKADSKVRTWFDNKFIIPDVGPHGLSTRFVVTQMINLPLNILLAHFCTVILDEPSVKLSRWAVSKIRSDSNNRKEPWLKS